MVLRKTFADAWARLARSGWDEFSTRARQEIAKRGDAVWYPLLARFRNNQPEFRSGFGGRFFFSVDELPEVIGLLRHRLPLQVEQTIEQAGRICGHNFDLLGYSALDYGRTIDWHLDVVHGKSAPRKPWFQIHILDFEEVGDVKVTWELNRHQHLVTLAKAFRLAGEKRFLEELIAQWYHWQRENPYPRGVNWASSLEVGFRTLSWLWVGHLLIGCSDVPDRFPMDLAGALALNGRHIEKYLSTYFSPNTHLIGEAAALFFLGTLCPQFSAAQRWQGIGWKILCEEVERQVQPDGMHFEQSLYYHVYALDFFLHARILAAANHVTIPHSFDRTLEKMLEVLCTLGQNHMPPRLGDDDGGRVFDPRRNRAEHLLDPLATGAILFERADFKAAAADIREETLWLLGPQGIERFDELPPASPPGRSAALPSSGVYAMPGGELLPQNLIAHAGPMGVDSAGHSHADALSVHWTVDGREALIDPGTYVYVSSGPDRDSFRGTAAHNTLCVDGASQAEPAGPFSWRFTPSVRIDHWQAGKAFDLLVASHDGYERFSSPAIHRRWVFNLRPAFWLVRDCVEGKGTHHLDLSWHFAPGWKHRMIGDRILMEDENRLTLALLAAKGHGWSSEMRDGWYSVAYGKRGRSPVLQFQTDVGLPAEFVTLFLASKNASVDMGELTAIAPEQNSGVRGYSYRTSTVCHHIFFSGAGLRWKAGRWASDAEFLYCETTSEGGLTHVILCSGSYVEIDGQQLLALDHRIARWEWPSKEPIG
jgi:hypothetical protein